MFSIDQEINAVENIFRQLTGAEPKRGETPASPIPPEVDPERYVRENLRRLYGALQTAASGQQQTTMVPPLNVLESDREWLCTVDMPGVTKEDVSVQVNQGWLQITAIRRSTHVEGQRPLLIEASACRWERVIALPNYLKGDSVTSRLENGVLNVRFERDATSNLKEVPVA